MGMESPRGFVTCQVALSEFVGVPVPWIILSLGIAVTLYTVLGGIEAVVWTDVVQVFVLLGGALVCVGILLFSMPEGFVVRSRLMVTMP